MLYVSDVSADSVIIPQSLLISYGHVSDSSLSMTRWSSRSSRKMFYMCFVFVDVCGFELQMFLQDARPIKPRQKAHVEMRWSAVLFFVFSFHLLSLCPTPLLVPLLLSDGSSCCLFIDLVAQISQSVAAVQTLCAHSKCFIHPQPCCFIVQHISASISHLDSYCLRCFI